MWVYVRLVLIYTKPNLQSLIGIPCEIFSFKISRIYCPIISWEFKKSKYEKSVDKIYLVFYNSRNFKNFEISREISDNTRFLIPVTNFDITSNFMIVIALKVGILNYLGPQWGRHSYSVMPSLPQPASQRNPAFSIVRDLHNFNKCSICTCWSF